MDFSPLPNWALDEYRCKCAGLIDGKSFDAIDVGGKNLAIYDRNCFKRDTVLGAWKRHWTVLSRRCVEILVNTSFAYMPPVWYEPEYSYCRKLWKTTAVNVEVADGYQKLKYSFFYKPYTSVYLIRCGTHQTRALELEMHQRTEVRNLIFVGLHDPEMFAVL